MYLARVVFIVIASFVCNSELRRRPAKGRILI